MHLPGNDPDPAQNANWEPLVRKLPQTWDPEYCFRRLSGYPGCIWLDSSMQSETLGRYSYMGALPSATVRADSLAAEPLKTIQRMFAGGYSKRIDELPPMQGGWMGCLGYEYGAAFERIPVAKTNDFNLPLANFGFYDCILCWDHFANQGWIVSQGMPGRSSSRRSEVAYGRMTQLLGILESPPRASRSPESQTSSWQAGGYARRVPADSLATQHPTRWSNRWYSNFSAMAYRRAVERCVDYIHAGDIFQVNLSQRLLGHATAASPDLYLHLRKCSPAPFSGYADFGRVQIVSTSPERFVSLQAGRIETRPIKGTRPRLSDPTADTGMAELLTASPKDRSENIMIVDLLRNDISRVAKDDSVRVPALCAVERYPYVWHLVSVVQAELAAGRDAIDLIEATFPGGSITGAPKIRAMEIIAELEPTRRGAYCGSMGYFSVTGDIDFNILIRTLTACGGWWQVPVGGGIVASSDPHLEEQETWHKAEGILRAIDRLEK